MAFSFDPIEIGPQRTIYCHMALIHTEDLQADKRIEPPPTKAVCGPKVKKRKVEGCTPTSTGLNHNHCSSCRLLNSLCKPKYTYGRGVSRDIYLGVTVMYSSMSMCICEYRALSVSMSLGPVSYMRTEAPYPLGYSEPLCFSGPTPAQLRLRFGTPTGPKYCAT